MGVACFNWSTPAITCFSKFLAKDNDSPAFWLVPQAHNIWAIIVKFDQIRKNWWRISCAKILEVGKKIFGGVFGKKKMSRFEEVSPEKIKRIAWKLPTASLVIDISSYPARPRRITVKYTLHLHLIYNTSTTSKLCYKLDLFPMNVLCLT